MAGKMSTQRVLLKIDSTMDDLTNNPLPADAIATLRENVNAADMSANQFLSKWTRGLIVAAVVAALLIGLAYFDDALTYPVLWFYIVLIGEFIIWFSAGIYADIRASREYQISIIVDGDEQLGYRSLRAEFKDAVVEEGDFPADSKAWKFYRNIKKLGRCPVVFEKRMMEHMLHE